MELLIILAIILMFFGARRVPQLDRSLGSGIREFRKEAAGAADDKGELERRGHEDGEEPPPNNGATAPGQMPRAGENGTPSVRQKPVGDRCSAWDHKRWSS